MLLLIYDLCSAASWLLCIKTYKSKRSQIYFTDKYLHAASYTNSTMKNGLKSFTFPRYQRIEKLENITANSIGLFCSSAICVIHV